MKVYNLCCDHDHSFEGWFSSEADFNRQLQEQRIQCPVCESAGITRLPSAPRLNLSASESRFEKEETVRQVFAEIMRQLVESTEDVGNRFAEEARRIHYREAPERAIRGVATIEQCEELSDEGIEIGLLPLPVVPKESLQ